MQLSSVLPHHFTKLRRQNTLLLLALLMLVGGWLRLWNIDGTLMFQGDQGRDALIVSRIFKEGDIIAIGPGSSIGNVYLGPFYYYFMLPFLWLSYPSPVGPAVGVALVSILTIPLLYLVTQKLSNTKTAWLTTLFFTFSAPIIQYSRFSWNPNLAPTFSLLVLYFTYQAWQGKHRYWLLVALSFGLLIQLHYLALLIGVGAGVVWLLQLWQLLKDKKRKLSDVKSLALNTLGSLLTFGLTLVPLIIFDARRNWLNATGFYQLFFKSEIFSSSAQVTETARPSIWMRLIEVPQRFLIRDIFGLQDWASLGLLAILLISLFFLFKRARQTYLWLPGIFVATSLLGVLFFNEPIHLHYIIYLLPMIFMLLSAVITYWLEQKTTWPLALVAVSLFFYHNLRHISLSDINWTIHDVEKVSKLITEKLNENEPYLLVLLGPSKDYPAQNYRYYLSTTNRPALLHDQIAQARALVVINEERLPTITNSPVYEIQAFPEKTQEEVYTIPNGPNIHIFRKTAP